MAKPFQFTVELEIKLEPLRVSVKAEPPAVAELGTIVVKMGIGLFGA